jgi:hypothetical protein
MNEFVKLSITCQRKQTTVRRIYGKKRNYNVLEEDK